MKGNTMAIPIQLTSPQKIKAGQLLRDIAGDPVEIHKLLLNPTEYLINKGVVSAAQVGDHRIVFHVNNANTTHYMVQFEEFYDAPSYKPPLEYDSASPKYIDPTTDRDEAYNFRLGDYTFALCG